MEQSTQHLPFLRDKLIELVRGCATAYSQAFLLGQESHCRNTGEFKGNRVIALSAKCLQAPLGKGGPSHVCVYQSRAPLFQRICIRALLFDVQCFGPEIDIKEEFTLFGGGVQSR